jgi:hypothetical protein
MVITAIAPRRSRVTGVIGILRGSGVPIVANARDEFDRRGVVTDTAE